MRLRQRLTPTGMVFLLAVGAMSLRAEDTPIVSPADELEILDPRVDPEGKPKAVLEQTPAGVKVTIPPVVIVHRYYYTGSRSFQGPTLPGGPTILVVHHPRTGEQLNLTVQMLPGAPRIEYERDEIVYDFGRRKITVNFGHAPRPFCGERDPDVSYHCSATRAFRPTSTKPPGPCHQLIHNTVRVVGGATMSAVNVLPGGTIVTEPILKHRAQKERQGLPPSLDRGFDNTIRTIR